MHLFPWIKDTEITEGPNVYDFLPEDYNNATKWVMGYLYNKPEIIGLGEPNETPEVLFPRFVQQELLKRAPGLSFDELGVRAVNRKVAYSRFDDFPRPLSVADTNQVAVSLSDPLLTNGGLTNWNPYVLPKTIFNTVQIQVFTNASKVVIDTGELRCCDLHDRKFLLFHERANPLSIRLKLTLAPYRPGFSTTNAFRNDDQLLASQMTNILANGPDGVTVKSVVRRFRQDETRLVERTVGMNNGDLYAICLSFGRVTKEMLAPRAQEIWGLERQIKLNPDLTNSLSAGDYQGSMAYLMGMAYYEKVDRFVGVNERLHKRSHGTMLALGISKLIAKRNTDGTLPVGEIKYVQPAVDMFYQSYVAVESPTARSDSGKSVHLANDDFGILLIADGSAKEHDIINGFFKDTDAISTVKLLQLTEQRHATNAALNSILRVGRDNVESMCKTFASLNGDTNMWNNVEEAIQCSAESQVLLTPGKIANNTGSYKGSSALLIDASQGSYAALISGIANGGYGSSFSSPSAFTSANLNHVSLGVDWSGNYSISYTAPSSTFKPLSGDSFAAYRAEDIFQDLNKGYLTLSPYNNACTWQTARYLDINPAGLSANQFAANAFLFSESRGSLGWLSDGLSQLGAAVHDPVHAVTGEFFVDDVDLSLVGPLPLDVRRNYSSLNLADNQFGIGWKFGFTPFLSVATNGAVMYAAEPDGSVLAYEPASTNTSFWIPTLRRNPQLVNNRKQGIGSTANLLLTRIERRVEAGATNFYLYAPNGDTRLYQQMSFTITNILERSRPYLVRWTDNRANSLQFSYGTDAQEVDYGELRRVDSSNGAYVQFRYDVYGHIVEAASGDGRIVGYEYDQFGDLIKVRRPDASEISFEYQHGTQSVTNGSTVTQEPISLHLLVKEIKPDGRALFNVYDSQNRVVIQASTAGADLNLVTNATFFYVNDFKLTNSVTNTITGSTEIADVFGKKTRYDYSSGLITNVTDPLGQTVAQLWYADNASAPGYPRSVWKRKDTRGLWTEFQYDQFGNVTNVITTGKLTGETGTQVAIQSARYNADNLPLVIVDAIGNSNVFRYHPTFRFLPEEVAAYKAGQAVSTNRMVYSSTTNVVTFGTATWTNMACGLLVREIRAFGSPDAATNDWAYDGGGFLTNEIRYTATADLALTNWFFYNGLGQLVERRNGARHRYVFDYDGLGRTKSEEVFAAEQKRPMSWQYSYYNQNGELTWSDGPRFDPEDYVWSDYDGAGRKIVEARWRSRAKADGSGVEAEAADVLYAITSFQYDPFGNLTNVIDPRGNFQVMAYDALGQVTQVVSYAASKTPLATNWTTYEAGGKVATQTNALGGVTQTLYTDTGEPRWRLNPDGSTNGWTYCLDGRVRKEFLSNGNYWETLYDDANRKATRLFRTSGDVVLAGTTNFFDRRGNLITNVTAEGAVFFTVYDGLDRVKISGGPTNETGTSSQQVSRFYYDATGLAVTNEDAFGKRAISVSDPLQRTVSVEIRDANANNALLWAQTTSYASNHQSVTTLTGTGPEAIKQTLFSDVLGRTVLQQSFPSTGAMNFSRLIYDAAGNLVESRDELNQATSSAYDGLNRLSDRWLADGAHVSYTYNAAGALASMTMPGNALVWSATYNTANQRLSEKLVSGGQAKRQFTSSYYTTGPLAGLPQSSADLGRSVTNTFAYDAFRRLVTNSAAGTQPEHTLVTAFLYDRQSRMTNCVQTSGVNPATEVRRRYDGYSQLTNEQVLVSGLWTNSFDQAWNASGERSALKSGAVQFDYLYRADARLARVTAFNAAYHFTYGTNGLLNCRSNAWRVVTIGQRDGRGRILNATVTAGATTALAETLTWRADSTLDTYAAVRAGTGAWNESRDFHYNSRGQLQTESFGVGGAAPVTAAYGFDANKLGIRTSTALSGGLANSWSAASGSPDGHGRILKETLNQTALNVQASGLAYGAATVGGTLDGLPLGGIRFNPSSQDGHWSASLTLAPGNHTLSLSAAHPLCLYTNASSSTFSVLGAAGVTNTYDEAGFVTARNLGSGTQTLKWDAAGRLVSVTLRDGQNNGYNWSAIYDGLGRRLRTTHAQVQSGVALPSPLATDSFYDPQAEFLEIGVALNGATTCWKVLGPDLDGSYGGLQGLGALEATVVQKSETLVTPVLQDNFGNVLASLDLQQSSILWSPTRVNGYGPVLGYEAPVLGPSVPLAEASLWRGKRIEPTGFYYLGARYYEPAAGRFLSPDPAGHAGSFDLYSFANGDPVNQFDPDGRLAAGFANGLGQWGSQAYATAGNVFDAVLNPIVGMFSPRYAALNLSGGYKADPIYQQNFDRGSSWYQMGHYAGYATAELGMQAGLMLGTEGFGSMASVAAMGGGLSEGIGASAFSVRTVAAFEAEAVASSAAPTAMRLAGAGSTATVSTGAGQAVVLNVNAGQAAVGSPALRGSMAAENAVPQVLQNQAAGNAARDAIAASRPGSLIEQNFRVTGGLRRVDVLDGTTAIESKVGRTGLGKKWSRVRQELARDIKMMRSGQVDAVEWHFSPSPKTGLGGPTGPLRDKLNKFGIPIVE